jgi:hypothetical protein
LGSRPPAVLPPPKDSYAMTVEVSLAQEDCHADGPQPSFLWDCPASKQIACIGKKEPRGQPCPQTLRPPLSTQQREQKTFHHEYVHNFFDGGTPPLGGLFRQPPDPTLPSRSSDPSSPPTPIPS